MTSAQTLIREPFISSYADDPARVIDAEVQRRRAQQKSWVRPSDEDDTAQLATDGPNVISLPQFEPLSGNPTEFFAAVQEWDGYVTGVFDDYFTADLRDATAEEIDVGEVAEIPIDELNPRDRPLLKEGLKFRWLVGYSKTRAGQFSKKHMLYFRPQIDGAKDPSEMLEIAARLRDRVKDLPTIDV